MGIQYGTTVHTLKATRCTPLLSFSESRIKAECSLTGRAKKLRRSLCGWQHHSKLGTRNQWVIFTRCVNLCIKTVFPISDKAADGVAYSSDTRCSSLRTSQFLFFQYFSWLDLFSKRSSDGNQHADLRLQLSAVYFSNRKWKVVIVCSISQVSLFSLIF